MMHKKRELLTEKLLFEHFLVSSSVQEEVFSPVPYLMDGEIFQEMKKSTIVLDNVVKRIIDSWYSGVTLKEREWPLCMGEFPLADEISDIKYPRHPFFWARFDCFQREQGGIFFSEFNYDKPCAQREILMSDSFNPKGNPNLEFKDLFRKAFKELLTEVLHSKDRTIGCAILVDPGHYEEVYLSHLYKKILDGLDVDFITVSAKNLYVENDSVKAFGKNIDIILRQFPTEFLHEVNDIEKILSLANEKLVIIVNDPRSIIGQAKSLFCELWRLVNDGSGFLTDEEKAVILQTVPKTVLLKEFDHSELVENRELYVIKAIYGRYSENVFIGNMFTKKEWIEVVEITFNEPQKYIVQEFCKIKKEKALKYNGFSYENRDAFGNFGIYLINGNFAGACVRWSSDYLSHDDTVWSTPLGVRDRKVYFELNMITEGKKQGLFTKEMLEEAAFKYGFTDMYTGENATVAARPIVLERELYKEIEDASNFFAKMVRKVTDFVCENISLFGSVLGINERLMPLISQKLFGCMTFLGRLDWVVDTEGNLKLLEFNSETPGGILESVHLNAFVKKRLEINFDDPNEIMAQMIKVAFDGIISDFNSENSPEKKIKSLAFISSSYHEDWYNLKTLQEIVNAKDFIKMQLGDVSGLSDKNGKLYLYDTEVDGVYRYYPLDWFMDEHFGELLETMKEYLCISHPISFISQSKAFFALLWELCETKWLNDMECEFVRKYIPKTVLHEELLETDDFCIKPFFEREGNGVTFNYFNPFQHYEVDGENFIYQERVNICPFQATVDTWKGINNELLYPVVGAYIIGDEFGGIFCRAGNLITDKRALFLPCFVKN